MTQQRHVTQRDDTITQKRSDTIAVPYSRQGY